MYNEITEENIKKLVQTFYAKVIKDEAIGTFFTSRLGKSLDTDLWQTHLTLLNNFWSGMILGSGKYRGNPFAPHALMEDLDVQHFQVWLQLFHATVDALYDGDAAQHFKQRSAMIASNFMKNLNLT